ncbi:MAG TPA: hypothetical protein VIP09_02285 [Dehalococcoidia bacterium]|jgi:streptogramin lyase
MLGKRLYWYLAAACAVVGLAGGLAFAIARAGGNSVLPEQPATPANPGAGNNLKLLDSGSDAIQFPAFLGPIQGRPTDITVDDSGRVWAASIDEDGSLWLNEGQPQSEIQHYRIPTKSVPSNAELAMAGKGELVIGAGQELIRFNLQTLAYSTLTLPAKQTDAASSQQGVGAVVDLHVDAGYAYVSRFGEPGITRVSLGDEAVEVISVPEQFADFDHFLVTGQLIWLLRTADTQNGPDSQIGMLDTASGKLTVVDGKVRTAAPFKSGILALRWDPQDIAYVDSSGAHPIDVPGLDTYISTMGPDARISIAPDGQTVWISDVTSNSILRVSLTDLSIQSYPLPMWQLPGSGPNCPNGGDCSHVFDVRTRVVAIDTSSNGDVYFAEDTINRLGLILLNQ